MESGGEEGGMGSDPWEGCRHMAGTPISAQLVTLTVPDCVTFH